MKSNSLIFFSNSNLSYSDIIKAVFLNLIILIVTYILFVIFTRHLLIPDPTSLLRYDANHYCNIKNNGYTFNENYGSSVAFFPGFPYLWKLTNLGIRQISILNLFIFLGSFVFLCKQFAHNVEDILLFLSLPTIMFMYVPYSEALFFVPSVLLLIGLKKRITWLIMMSLFLCSLCRSAANVFIPAIIITEIISYQNPSRIKNILLYILSSLSGIFLVALLQYSQTRQWLGFITTQKNWEVGLRMPNLPFHTWGDMQHLDGPTLLAGLVCCGIMIILFWDFIYKKVHQPNKAFIFSLLYVSGLTLFTIAFKGGNLFSLNRYIIPTAFFFVIFSTLIWQKKFTWKEVGLYGLIIFAFWLSIGSYAHIRVLIGFFLLTLYLILYLLINNDSKKIANISFYLLYGINIVLQVHFLFKFLDNKWIG